MAQQQADAQIQTPGQNQRQTSGEQAVPNGERRDGSESGTYKRSIYALPISVQVVIGTSRPTIAELLQLREDSLLQLDSKVDDPVDLCINDRVIARGELVETDPETGAIGIKLTQIVDISEDFLR